MPTTEVQLARAGCADEAPPPCWRVVRASKADSAPRTEPGTGDPACSRALLRWRDRLLRAPDPSPYRITRIDKKS
jgi:hypothetical protein